MNTLILSLSNSEKAFMESQISTGKYANASDYIQQLILRDKMTQELYKDLVEGGNSKEVKSRN